MLLSPFFPSNAHSMSHEAGRGARLTWEIMGASMAETVCSECGGSGWKVVEKDDISAAQRCECLFSDRSRRLEENANIPPLYRNASFDNFMLPRENPIAMRELATVMTTVKSFTREFPMAN